MAKTPHRFTKDNARELGKLGGRPKLTELQKKENAARAQMIEIYRSEIHKRLERADTLYSRAESEIMNKTPGTLSAAEIELLIRLAKQYHELTIGKPKQQTEVSGEASIRVVINEEPYEDPKATVLDITPQNVQIEEYSENG